MQFYINEEQMLFAELNKRDLRKKEEMERIKKADQRNAVLAIKKQLKKRLEDEEKIMSAHEK